MARPRKMNLDYFPVDVNILSNAKMMLAVNAAGVDAFSVYVAMLSAIYSHSYWMPKDDARLQVMPARLHMDVDKFNAAYDALIQWGLLEEVAPASDEERAECPCGAAITSHGIQEQYFGAKKAGPKVSMPFLLLKPELPQREQGF